jgi:hypothetical protein
LALGRTDAVYLRTDEELELANAMKMAAEFAGNVLREPHLWRWIIIALHNAAQGAMVLSLRHGNGLLALSDESYAEWMSAYEKNEAPPPERLDSYLNLYKKVKHSQWGRVGGNKRFVPVGQEGSDIKRLNALRNEFIHFTPKSWSLELDGLPRIAASVTRLISFLAVETQNVFWHSVEARDALAQSTVAFQEAIERVGTAYKSAA